MHACISTSAVTAMMMTSPSRSKSQSLRANKLSIAFLLAAGCAFLRTSATLAPGLLQWCGINGHYSTLACTASTSCTVCKGS